MRAGGLVGGDNLLELSKLRLEGCIVRLVIRQLLHHFAAVLLHLSGQHRVEAFVVLAPCGEAVAGVDNGALKHSDALLGELNLSIGDVDNVRIIRDLPPQLDNLVADSVNELNVDARGIGRSAAAISGAST